MDESTLINLVTKVERCATRLEDITKGMERHHEEHAAFDKRLEDLEKIKLKAIGGGLVVAFVWGLVLKLLS